ncbi:neutral/alkaline non-lysosomal ceramidase N-terminal domain-containing protein [Blastopirellula sp. JC732]|uniref:Neutral/alkaline non-lysosomal ceramidase N-terminal domain-containing protein n=1 Tax=Blastopirellula sediminis TaxID=2894196 RepID=A0A9X1MLB1_9BACT|nr:neutral/alkaline non-lysosomal ceramidase N-terminal domain-containing protein [Blastopirellula sediminis]MCC9607589.1 neutral/alkaline non-lysosomal ceramidase N-terminal domain-containing protein [Blastopirellula sediminis]MCC9629118.1 neutral/alkaline non-lysosomal ceramidase N-terminal domain-containing protein [Blastopirellula sediminis]
MAYRIPGVLAVWFLLSISLTVRLFAADFPYLAGTAKVEITPDYPIMLSGYASRGLQEVSETIQPLYARALAVGEPGKLPVVLMMVDNCGVPASVSDAVSRELMAKYQIPRANLAVCATHTHYAPMLSGVLQNLPARPIPPEKQQAIDRYTDEFVKALVKAASVAIESRQPARLEFAIGEVGFAANRRTAGGPTDHQLPLLTVYDANDKVRSLVVGYACHCTTIAATPAFIGDWAGYAAEYLEREYPGAVALAVIGCGGDQNPNPRGKLEFAQQYGHAIRDEVVRLMGEPMRPINGEISTQLENIPLRFAELPTLDQWREMAKESGINGFYAGKYVQRIEAGEVIPTHLDYPVQSWTFADDLTIVFLGGEVTVDYSLRLKRMAPAGKLWVAAYSNDVRTYVPSARVLKEGGYEGGGSRIWYDHPQVFAGEIEESIIGEVERQLPSLVPKVE